MNIRMSRNLPKNKRHWAIKKLSYRLENRMPALCFRLIMMQVLR